MTRVVAYVPDLMDRSRIAGVADVTFVDRPAALAAAATEHAAEVVVVDLTRPGVLEAVSTVPVRVLGFANHTERDLLESARAAGCEQALARSAFFSRLTDLLG
jgi:AmiR/NasT family two-component response regulator